MCRNSAPTIQRSEQAVDGCLQNRRVVAHVAGFSERLVDDRVERNDALDEIASLGLRIRQLRSRQCQHAAKSTCDLNSQTCECTCKSPPAAAEIGPGED